IDNITTKNIATVICVLDGSNNYKVHKVTSYNFQTCIWSQGTNYIIDTISGYNTTEQFLIWLQKNHPTSPRELHNGMDLVLCMGDNYSLLNLNAENPIERCIYSQGSNVTANNLRCTNADGFKFV